MSAPALVTALPVRPSRTTPVRVGLRASDPLTAAGLRRWLRAEPREVRVVPDLADAEVVVVAPDAMPRSWYRRAVATSRGSAPEARVMVLADAAHGALPQAAELDADVVVDREAMTAPGLLRSVLALAWGVPAAATVPAAADRTDEPTDGRARTVLQLLADGHDLSEIATRLAYSERTVKNILYGFLGEAGARNRVQAVAAAIRSGLI